MNSADKFKMSDENIFEFLKYFDPEKTEEVLELLKGGGKDLNRLDIFQFYPVTISSDSTFLMTEYNKHGDYYRKPGTNQFYDKDMNLCENTENFPVLGQDVLALEIQANDLYQKYVTMYLKGAVYSCFVNKKTEKNTEKITEEQGEVAVTEGGEEAIDVYTICLICRKDFEEDVETEETFSFKTSSDIKSFDVANIRIKNPEDNSYTYDYHSFFTIASNIQKDGGGFSNIKISNNHKSSEVMNHDNIMGMFANFGKLVEARTKQSNVHVSNELLFKFQQASAELHTEGSNNAFASLPIVGGGAKILPGMVPVLPVSLVADLRDRLKKNGGSNQNPAAGGAGNTPNQAEETSMRPNENANLSSGDKPVATQNLSPEGEGETTGNINNT